MRFADDFHLGQVLRLTMPYFAAERGFYTIVYFYRNGWLGLISQRDGRRYNVPRHICRPVETAIAPMS